MLCGLLGHSREAQQKQEQAFRLINSSKNSWPLKVKEDLFARYYWCYKELFVHSSTVFQQVLNLGKDILKDLEADDLFYKKGKYEGHNHENIFLIRRDLIALYNKMGNFNSALDCAQETEFFLNQLSEKGISLINREATFRMRKGYTLLRLNKLSEARANLERCINVHRELGETPCIAQALLYLSEVLIRQNELEKAYQCAKTALIKMVNVSSNNDRFFKAICYYFLAILELKNKNTTEVLIYLNEFLNIANDVCKSMLDDISYASLLQQNAFSKLHNSEDISKGFIDAIKIFELIYEPSHPFITDFARIYGGL
jgi:tetratricopeptide (TPR) repeat protein